jgi:hypothetical protein
VPPIDPKENRAYHPKAPKAKRKKKPKYTVTVPDAKEVTRTRKPLVPTPDQQDRTRGAIGGGSNTRGSTGRSEGNAAKNPGTPDARDRNKAARDKQLARSVPKAGDAPQRRSKDFAGADRYNESDKAFEQRWAARKEKLKRLDPDSPEFKTLAQTFARDKQRKGDITKHKYTAELEGKGHVANFFAKAAKTVKNNSASTGTGSGPMFGAIVGGKGSTFAATNAEMKASQGGKFVLNLLEDAVNFPAQAIPSAYVPIASAVEATQGHPARGKAFLKDLKEHDVIYNTGAAAVDAVRGREKQAAKHLKAAGKTAYDHPGLTTLEVIGTKGGIGRGATRTVNTAGQALRHAERIPKIGKHVGSEKVGQKLVDSVSTQRAPKRVDGTNVEIKQEYSKDIFKRRRQKKKDRKGTRKANEIRTRAHYEPDLEQKQELFDQANAKDPFYASDKDVSQRTNESEQVREDVRRAGRKEALHDVEQALGKAGMKGGPATSLIAQNIVGAHRIETATGHFHRTLREDMQAYRSELQAEHDSGRLDAGERALNTQLRADIDKILSDRNDAELVEIEQAARRYEQVTRPGQEELNRLGFTSDATHERAPEVPYAVRHENATVKMETRTPDEHVDKFVKGEQRRVAGEEETAARAHEADTRATREQTIDDMRLAQARAKPKTKTLMAKRLKAERKRNTAKVQLAREKAVRGVRANQLKTRKTRDYLMGDKEYAEAHETLRADEATKRQAREEYRIAKGTGNGVEDARQWLDYVTSETEISRSKLNARKAKLMSDPLVVKRKSGSKRLTRKAIEVRGRRGKTKNEARADMGRVGAGKAYAQEQSGRPRPTEHGKKAVVTVEQLDAKIAKLETKLREEQKRTRGVPVESAQEASNRAQTVTTKRAKLRKDFHPPKKYPDVKDTKRPAIDKFFDADYAHDKAKENTAAKVEAHQGKRAEGPATKGGTKPRVGGAVQRHQQATDKATGIPSLERKVRVTDSTGREMSMEQLKRIREDKGFKHPPAFVGHGRKKSGSFNVSSSRAPGITERGRTGASVIKGTFDAGVEKLIEQAVKTRGLIDAHNGFKSFVHEVGYREKAEKEIVHLSKVKAEKLAASLNATTGRKWRVIRANPFAGSKKLMEDLLEGIDTQTEQANTYSEMFQQALRGEGDDTAGDWVLVPEAAAKTLQEHLNVTAGGEWMQAWAKANQLFRGSVLATSPSWLAGNTVEGGLRSAIAAVGPRSYITGRRVLKEHAKLVGGKQTRAHQELVFRTVGGGHMKMQNRTRIRRGADQWNKDSRVGKAAIKMVKFFEKPGPRHAADAWDGYTRFVFDSLNGRIETGIQTAMLGKALRSSDLMSGEMLKTGRKAVQQAAEGLKNTNEQVAFGREIDRMYGKYGKWSPDERKVIAMYTPFMAWTLNSFKFVYDVLPRDHPVLTALIAATEIATQDWLKDHGLNMFMKNAMPSFLLGIPDSAGGHYRPAKFTPFGAFNDPVETVGGLFLPSLAGLLPIAKDGEDWKGKELKSFTHPGQDMKATPIDKAGYIVATWMQSTIPAVAVPSRLFSIGKKATSKDSPAKRAAEVIGAYVPPKKPKRTYSKPKSIFDGGLPKQSIGSGGLPKQTAIGG